MDSSTGLLTNPVTQIQFDSISNILVVAVRGHIDATPDAPKGWRHILEHFYYECQKNDDRYIRRTASKFIAFYRTHSPQAITHWATVKRITEKDNSRRYYLDAVMKLDNNIPKGDIPPNFSGGGLTIPLATFFKLRNTDELYSQYRTEDSE